jgi:hypothetical protein
MRDRHKLHFPITGNVRQRSRRAWCGTLGVFALSVDRVTCKKCLAYLAKVRNNPPSPTTEGINNDAVFHQRPLPRAG